MPLVYLGLPITQRLPARLFSSFSSSSCHICDCGHVCTGVDAVLSKYNTTGKISVHFSADSNSIVKLEKAESVIELWEDYEVEVPIVAEQANSTEAAMETLESEDDPADEVSSSLYHHCVFSFQCIWCSVSYCSGCAAVKVAVVRLCYCACPVISINWYLNLPPVLSKQPQPCDQASAATYDVLHAVYRGAATLSCIHD